MGGTSDAAVEEWPHHHDHVDLHHLHLHGLHLEAPPRGGTVVAGLAVYEVVAVTVNAALEEDVLPTISGALGQFRWGSVFGRLVAVGALAAAWSLVGATVVVATGASRSRRR